jgi:hypothetical protein
VHGGEDPSEHPALSPAVVAAHLLAIFAATV